MPLTKSKALSEIDAAINHQAKRSVPKYSAAPVMRWMIDIVIVIGGR